MNEQTSGSAVIRSADAACVPNERGVNRRFSPGAYVETTGGHRLQVGRDGHCRPLNKSSERHRRLKQASALV